MRWVIVGPYPPEQGEGPGVVGGEVIARLDAGDLVWVISPRPSAAHLHRRLVGLRALWWLYRQVGRGDGLWVRVEPGILFSRRTNRVGALVERVLAGVVLRRAASSVLDVGDVAMLPGGRAGAMVFGSAGRIVAHDVADHDVLLKAGAPPAKVVLADGVAAAPDPGSAQLSAADAPRPVGLEALVAGVDRTTIEGAVRQRAAEAPLQRRAAV